MIYLFVAVVVTIVGLGGEVDAVTCYNCTYGDGSNCADPFSATGIKTCTGPTCSKGKSTSDGVQVVVRSCYPTAVDTQCGDVTTQGISVRACFCSTDYCNTGKNLHAHLIYLIPAVIIGTLTSFAARLF